MHYANMVRDVVAGLQEVLKQEPVPVEASAVIQDTQVTHVVNAVQENQYHIDAQLQKMQSMMQAMKIQYAEPQPTYQAYGGQGHYVGNS